MIAWEIVEQLVYNVTVVDARAPSRLNQGSLYNTGNTAIKAEARIIEKFRELMDNGYSLQREAMEVSGSSVEGSEISLSTQ